MFDLRREAPPSSSPLHLDWGPGPGPRLLAPGLPDIIVADGRRLGCSVPGGVARWDGESVTLWPTGSPDRISAHRDHWGVAINRARDSRIVCLRDGSAVRVGAAPSWPGGGFGVTRHGGQRHVIDLQTGHLVSMPPGAHVGAPLPWPDQPGITWVSEGTVYRKAGGGRPSVVGSHSGGRITLAAGPSGAVVLSGERGSQVAAPGRSLRPCAQPLDAGTAAFSADGRRALVAVNEGVVELDLRTGVPLHTCTDAMVPVGYARMSDWDQPQAIVFDEDQGRLLTLDGETLRDGFTPTAWARSGDRLYGPGEAAWDMRAGAPVWTHDALCAEHIAACDDWVATVFDRRVTVLDTRGRRRHRWDLPAGIDPWQVSAVGGLLVVHTDDRALAWHPDGRVQGPTVPVERDDGSVEDGSVEDSPVDDSPVEVAGLPMAGSAQVGGRTWAWSDDGFLMVV